MNIDLRKRLETIQAKFAGRELAPRDKRSLNVAHSNLEECSIKCSFLAHTIGEDLESLFYVLISALAEQQNKMVDVNKWTTSYSQDAKLAAVHSGAFDEMLQDLCPKDDQIADLLLDLREIIFDVQGNHAKPRKLPDNNASKYICTIALCKFSRSGSLRSPSPPLFRLFIGKPYFESFVASIHDTVMLKTACAPSTSTSASLLAKVSALGLDEKGKTPAVSAANAGDPAKGNPKIASEGLGFVSIRTGPVVRGTIFCFLTLFIFVMFLTPPTFRIFIYFFFPAPFWRHSQTRSMDTDMLEAQLQISSDPTLPS